MDKIVVMLYCLNPFEKVDTLLKNSKHHNMKQRYELEILLRPPLLV